MKLVELLNGVDVCTLACDPALEIAEVCYDSRRAAPRSLFVAVRGFATDGHAYIGTAVQGGCVAVVCEEKPEEDIPYVLVRDSRRALAVIAANRFGHPEREMRLVGVTGTKGKTTATHLIKGILERATGERVGLIGTNHILFGEFELPSDRTTPESYELYSVLRQMADAGCTTAVMEVSSHSLMLDRVYGLHFAVAAYTNLLHDHLDFHKTMEEYARAKAILVDRCDVCAINLDDAYAHVMLDGKTCKKLTFSATKDEADMVAKNIKLKPDRVEFEAVSIGSIGRAVLGIPGMFSVYNALTAIACATLLGISLEDALAALRTLGGVKGRFEVVPVPADYTVLIDYAHNPDSMKNVLETVGGFARGRVIAMFGAGGNRDKTKRPVMGRIGASLSDICVITTDNPRDEDPDTIIEEVAAGARGQRAEIVIVTDRREAIVRELTIAREGDIVVLLGKGHETYQEVRGQKLHLDEREEIARYFENKRA
ncbi:MAG: UDP-N-acetylmuramoyl-L-alanyl-D-glutamate--2,6-diaminopimelate ligase [Clostridium sp. SCN 57-10]|nr:MAG: UDP-N-acetylmuramoyl-L-alanyl-D-glutamate--2,6-diaminopimelate ligase [Clostridium sp. SCN 57-10]